MNAVDGSDHYTKTSDEPPPSLLAIILDTSPYAWDLLKPDLPLSTALANLQVFINAHLAISNGNKIIVIASHPGRAVYLYNERSAHSSSQTAGGPGISGQAGNDADGDTKMGGDGGPGVIDNTTRSDADYYRPFRQVEENIHTNLSSLMDSTKPEHLALENALNGALSRALGYINKEKILHASSTTTAALNPANSSSSEATTPQLIGRILVVSVSGDPSSQYIAIMNSIFAAQKGSVPIDTCKIAGGESVFLQQASKLTSGTYIKLEQPKGLLQYLMMAFLPDQTTRKMLVQPTAVDVDFSAVCFCHRKKVDIGFVCSVCLSIFCSPPEGAICLTCGTHLQLGDYGGTPALVPLKKKKKKSKADEEGKGVDPDKGMSQRKEGG